MGAAAAAAAELLAAGAPKLKVGAPPAGAEGLAPSASLAAASVASWAAAVRGAEDGPVQRSEGCLLGQLSSAAPQEHQQQSKSSPPSRVHVHPALPPHWQACTHPAPGSSAGKTGPSRRWQPASQALQERRLPAPRRPKRRCRAAATWLPQRPQRWRVQGPRAPAPPARWKWGGGQEVGGQPWAVEMDASMQKGMHGRSTLHSRHRPPAPPARAALTGGGVKAAGSAVSFFACLPNKKVGAAPAAAAAAGAAATTAATF